ncbi:hypothetical protein GOP47_0021498 [Adiantum capillus-veneris]|uniref:Uncharacterized protein n=1 Tax=Adiantum capillus-veneris TaxID=13818 RepID=A0A9D4Z7X3_ADICA|nr:hypothetical protein GOP47_0021498 [Adiantum capillus-veneris]
MEPYTPQNILMSGAAGFIGSHAATRLARLYPHYNIVVLDKLDYCSSLKNLLPCKQSSPNFKFVKGDIASADLVNYLLLTERIDTIMHFAAQTHVDNSFGNSFEFTHNNVYGTHVLLEAAKLMGGQIRRFVHVSTDEVYGEAEADAPVGNHESCRLLPTNPYSATKASSEMLAMAYGTSYGLPVIITRGNNVYGPNQYPEKLISKFIALTMHGKPLPIHGDGSNARSYLYVEDVVEAFDLILHKGSPGQAYNIGTKEEKTVLEVAKDICMLFKVDPSKVVQLVKNRPFNDKRYFLDGTKLAALGWRQRTTWEEGLRKTKNWYVSNPDWWGDVSSALVSHARMPWMTNIKWDNPHPGQNIVSELADLPSNAASTKEYNFLIYGRTGWIGGYLGKLCAEQGISYHYGLGRLENRAQLEADIKLMKPTHVFNAAGLTGTPNIDWCESHKIETIRANVVGTLNLADVCLRHSLLLMNFASGCVYDYDEAHPMGSGIGFSEEDKPNYDGSFYSKTKAMVEELLKNFDNVCTLRVRLLVSSDLSNPRNAISKMTKYEKVVNIANSMTVLDEMLPMAIEMAKRNLRGIWNFTNPGTMSHNEILEMYRKYVDPSFKWVNFTAEEQAAVLVAPRCNNELEVSKLKAEFPSLLPVRESLRKHVFEKQRRRKSKL